MRFPVIHPVQLLAGVLLLSLVLRGSTPVQAQLVSEPESLEVELAQGEETRRTLTLRNVGSGAVAFCFNFERPLQREEAGARLSNGAVGKACGEIGEFLLEVSNQTIAIGWSPYGLTMTADGRLFAADNFPRGQTHELTPGLEIVRSFEHPFEDELDFGPATQGLAFNADTGTLWWLNVEQSGSDLRRALLLEGDLDGVPTGRRIELPTMQDAPPPEDVVYPYGLSYDPVTHCYYYVGAFLNGESLLWVVDTLGIATPGYPATVEAYPRAPLGFGPDAHGGANGDPEAVRIELAVNPPNGDGFDRLIVTDSAGRAVGIPEVMLPDVSGGSGFGSSITGNPLRSRLDPNGLLYFPFTSFFEAEGIVGIRPHPLPPSWLALSAWDGELEPGESVEIMLTFSAGTRDIGNTYTAALQVFEAETGAALEVPLAFEVVPVTASEGAATPVTSSLSVFPNPAIGQAAVAVSISERSDLRVVVYDVLGRRVAVLHEGVAEAGQHRFGLETAQLPSGVYLVRATGEAFALTQRLTVVR